MALTFFETLGNGLSRVVDGPPLSAFVSYGKNQIIYYFFFKKIMGGTGLFSHGKAKTSN